MIKSSGRMVHWFVLVPASSVAECDKTLGRFDLFAPARARVRTAPSISFILNFALRAKVADLVNVASIAALFAVVEEYLRHGVYCEEAQFQKSRGRIADVAGSQQEADR